MKKVAIQNLGCSKNIIDGEKISFYLNSCGFETIKECEKADIIVVNTCTFIQEATEETIHTILEMGMLKKEGLCKTLLVSGCFSERYRSTIQNQFPEVDLWVGVKTWPKELSDYFNTRRFSSFKRKLTTSSATQYLKISDGCSHRCTFCIIPSIRGVLKSRSLASILNEASWLSSQGVKECILVSQDTSFYGRDTGSSLLKLLDELLLKTDFQWIRLMYLYPNFVTTEILTRIKSERRLCSYFDIPLQHISSPILKAMNRNPCDSKSVHSLVEQIRTILPEATIRTSFILGFPGEKKSHFEELLKFVEWARFEKVGVFPFSPEKGTQAYQMKPIPRNSTTQSRCETLLDLQKEISREICVSRIGSRVPILIDRQYPNSEYKFEGRTEGDAPEIDGRVYLKEGDCAIGEFVEVTVIDADDYDLFAEL